MTRCGLPNAATGSCDHAFVARSYTHVSLLNCVKGGQGGGDGRWRARSRSCNPLSPSHRQALRRSLPHLKPILLHGAICRLIWAACWHIFHPQAAHGHDRSTPRQPCHLVCTKRPPGRVTHGYDVRARARAPASQRSRAHIRSGSSVQVSRRVTGPQ